MRYLFVGSHQETSEDGRTLFFGDSIDLAALEGHDKTLADDGSLIPEETPAPAPTPAPTPAPPADTTAAASQPSTPEPEEAGA